MYDEMEYILLLLFFNCVTNWALGNDYDEYAAFKIRSRKLESKD